MADEKFPKLRSFELPEIVSPAAEATQLLRQQMDRQEELAGRFDAEDIYDHLLERIKVFQDDLEEDCELGIRLANFGVAAEIHVRQIGFRNPNLIEFTGILSDGSQVVLTQHISQLNFLMVSLAPLEETEAYRVGF